MPFNGQETQRRLEQFVDKFGRLYEANVEIKTGDPCEVLRPVGWKAPVEPSWFAGMLMPPIDDLEIVRMVPRLQRARKGYQVEIDHMRWLAKWDERDYEHQRKLRDFAQGMTRGRGVIELINNPSPELLKMVGPRPFPPRAFIEAAAAGNKWALGLDATIPKKAELLLEELESTVTLKRRKAIIGYDPLADDDDEPQTVGERVVALADPLMDDLTTVLDDLEEQFDPKATGGQKVPHRGRQKRTVEV